MARSRPVVHLELHTGDLDRARAFYAALCGWRPEQNSAAGAPAPYLALDMGSRRLGGGIVECATDRPVWLPYVEVPEVHAATERAHGLRAAAPPGARRGPGRRARRGRPARAARGAGRMAQRRRLPGRRRDRVLAAEALS